MSEQDQSREEMLSPEHQNLLSVIDEFLDESDKEFIEDLDFEDALGYVYGRLIDEDYDPDAVLEAAAVTEEPEEDHEV
jgi:hypothetical protein